MSAISSLFLFCSMNQLKLEVIIVERSIGAFCFAKIGQVLEVTDSYCYYVLQLHQTSPRPHDDKCHGQKNQGDSLNYC